MLQIAKVITLHYLGIRLIDHFQGFYCLKTCNVDWLHVFTYHNVTRTLVGGALYTY
jgi:hypothetical protein